MLGFGASVGFAVGATVSLASSLGLSPTAEKETTAVAKSRININNSDKIRL